ncbi:uncharacterized protein F4822DRAFT_428020 [Hypoxylon trugodes]|uniref:uncharacterized protein n=1 Tax=Hypoxylon trugodes TaxID=326681 RepID=UPI002199ACE1|nr:uncharacterized protein F4822DRAFT_428020 [Hypoxylon trugodes]KAI1389678.1 hypothetical protein F4822DRAFT_428020 [Hypoxylon trugodes]
MKGIVALLLVGLAAAVPVNNAEPSEDARTSRPHPTGLPSGLPTGGWSIPPLPSLSWPSGSDFPGFPEPTGRPTGRPGRPTGGPRPTSRPHPSGGPRPTSRPHPTGRPTGRPTPPGSDLPEPTEAPQI